MNEEKKSLRAFSYGCHWREWGDGNWQPVPKVEGVVVTYLPDTTTWWVKRVSEHNGKARPMRLSTKAGWGKFITAVRKLMAE